MSTVARAQGRQGKRKRDLNIYTSRLPVNARVGFLSLSLSLALARVYLVTYGLRSRLALLVPIAPATRPKHSAGSRRTKPADGQAARPTRRTSKHGQTAERAPHALSR